MRQTKLKLKLPVIVTFIVASLVMVIGNFHLCLLHSFIVEAALFVLIIFGCCFWTARARTSGKAWLRTGISLVIAIALQNAYLTWLHSESFPEILLSRKAREWKAETYDVRERMTKMTAAETQKQELNGKKDK